MEDYEKERLDLIEAKQQLKQVEAILKNKELIREEKLWQSFTNNEKQKVIKNMHQPYKLSRKYCKKLISKWRYPWRKPLKKWLSYTQEEWMKILCRIDWVNIYSK